MKSKFTVFEPEIADIWNLFNEVIWTFYNFAPTVLLIRENDNYYHNIIPKGAFIKLRRSDIMVENGLSVPVVHLW